MYEPLFSNLEKDDVMIKDCDGEDVRDITLNIYLDSLKYDEDVPDFKLFIYMISSVTDLSSDNLYVFSKGVSNKTFLAFVPTF